ncbi:porin family protein [uncultured Fibrella sp.]|uniref:porin family protein n=1 Tax=uncultured Fibrella sp. TaxID=1284596 RepID=UPI0035C9D021
MKPLFSLLICLATYPAFAQSPFRFEAETGVSSLRLPTPYRNGWHVRQQLTAYLQPRLGVALGLGWGGSSNNNPLTTQPNRYGQPDPNALLDFYNRQERMTDLSAVWLPVLTRRHQLKVQAGLSLQRRREVSIDSIFREQPGLDTYYDALPTYTDQSRVVPMAALGYDYRLSPRWTVGVNAVTYLPANEKAISTIGLRTSYRFNISRDSLGISNGPVEPLTWGVRLVGSRVGENGSSSASSRNITRFVAGLWTEYPLSLTWAMRGEINYAQRGYRFEAYSTGGRSAIGSQTEATYLEMPLLFRHEAAERWHLYAGPYLAFMLNGTSSSDARPTVAISPHTNSGLMLGADYQLSQKVSIDLRYQRDLLQISTTPYSNSYHSYQLGVNWQIR